jgi:hypothetical protein
MSTAITMQDLELEHAELLPSRETLCCVHYRPTCGGGGVDFTQVAAGQGNTNQIGLLNISALNGNLSGNQIGLL